MSTGRTATWAIVTDAPASETAPKAIAAASNAIASGRSRRSGPNVSPSAPAMTITTAISSSSSECVIELRRSDTITGSPVTR